MKAKSAAAAGADEPGVLSAFLDMRQSAGRGECQRAGVAARQQLSPLGAPLPPAEWQQLRLQSSWDPTQRSAAQHALVRVPPTMVMLLRATAVTVRKPATRWQQARGVSTGGAAGAACGSACAGRAGRLLPGDGSSKQPAASRESLPCLTEHQHVDGDEQAPAAYAAARGQDEGGGGGSEPGCIPPGQRPEVLVAVNVGGQDAPQLTWPPAVIRLLQEGR